MSKTKMVRKSPVAFQAIVTRFLPATNCRGSRVKATSASGLSATVDYPHDTAEGAAAHEVAFRALAGKLNWAGEYVVGGLAEGYAWVCIAPSGDNRVTVK